MQLIRSQFVLAAALALLAQQSAAQAQNPLSLDGIQGLDSLNPQTVTDSLNAQTLTDTLSKAVPMKRQAKGTLLKGLNVFGEDVDLPTDPASLTKMVKDAATHPAAPPAPVKREEAGLSVLGKIVPTNAADLTKMLQEKTAGMQQRDTGLDLNLDNKPAPQFLMDSLASGLKQRDFSTNDLSVESLEPTAEQAVKMATPIALAPVSPQLKMAGAGYKLAAEVAHEAGADAVAKQALDQTQSRIADASKVPAAPKLAKRAFYHDAVHHHRKRGSVDATDLKNTDLSGLQKVPAEAVKLAAPIALGKVGGYVGAAQMGVKTAQMVSNMAGVPQMVEKTGVTKMIQDATSKASAMAPKLPKLPAAPAAAPAKRDETTDELTKAGLGLGDSVRDSGLKLSHTATAAGNAFTKNLYGARPEKRNMVLPAFEVLPGAGPQAKEAAEQLTKLLPVPVPGVPGASKRMEKVTKRRE
ncbi:uncharacterized protein PFL1_02933 [Pseudozyma flocculosa PF-1]|uniref:Uncharacterized protein n=2 Tax=Pseudozyma flocculosa TaxID=84751 RepID=A0A5C3F4A8_9BASI|nr:uncharacterized protein PFL1_02933 [Pseudozyma flocculosa PF-1]EPQ29713.1 hypothetical protein PFL1_02933 [Pseudozyma flocculosa PF-1]SPO38289.1 uncharacterized protein PSFLO_03766 [Pseudozyma flocculosa]